MKASNIYLSAIIICFAALIPTATIAQFDNFSGQWRSFDNMIHMEKLTEDDQGIVKFTEKLNNGVAEGGRKLTIGYYKTDEQGQQFVQTYLLTEVTEGNITGSDAMNTVTFSGKISGNSTEQTISLTGNFVNGLNGVFGLELIYQNNTDKGRIIQMKRLLSIGNENPIDQSDVNNEMYRGMDIETRPATGDAAVSYWQVLFFKPESE